MQNKDNKIEEMSKMHIVLTKKVHMEAKAQASYRGISMASYVIDALIAQIAKDKKYQK